MNGERYLFRIVSLWRFGSQRIAVTLDLALGRIGWVPLQVMDQGQSCLVSALLLGICLEYLADMPTSDRLDARGVRQLV